MSQVISSSLTVSNVNNYHLLETYGVCKGINQIKLWCLVAQGSTRPYLSEHKIAYLIFFFMTKATERPSKRTTSSWCSHRTCHLHGSWFRPSFLRFCFSGCSPSASDGRCRRHGARGRAPALRPCNSGLNTWDGLGTWRSSATVWGPG